MSSLSPPRPREDEPDETLLLDGLTVAPPRAPARSWLDRLRAPAPGSRLDRMAAPLRSGRAGLAGVLLCGLVISVCAGGTYLLLPRSTRPVPGNLAGVFGDLGINLGLVGLIAIFGLIFLSYAVAVLHSDQLSARAVLIAIGILIALVLLAPPLLSTDVFSYEAYGRMGAQYGINPYTHGPYAIFFDPVFPLIGVPWSYVPTAYSPLFTALSYALAPLGIAAGVVAYKLIAALSFAAILAVVWKGAGLRGVDRVRAMALVGLNPVLVVYGVGGGHNDLLMLALIACGVYALLLQGRERAGGALLMGATAIKLTGGLLVPFALAEARRRGGPGRSRAFLIGAGAALLLLAGLSVALFGTGPLHLLSTLRRVQRQTGLQSIPGFISVALGLGDLGTPAQAVLTGGCLVAIAWLVRRVWIGQMDWITGAGWATFAMLVSASSLLPWYMAWLLPLAALSRDRRLFAAAIVMTGLGLTTL